MQRNNSGATPFAAEGGVTIAVTDARDPYEVLDDLIVVVEALCPIWPARDIVKL
jgi:hypothetical protein